MKSYKSPIIDRNWLICYNTYIATKGHTMSEPVETRVIEVCEGQWVVQWTTFSDTFATQAEAKAFEQDQLDSADYSE